MVISILRIFPSHEQRRQLLGLLRSVQGPTQAQPKCLSSRIYEEDGYESAVLYLEQWDSEPALQQHISSDLYRRVLAAVELSSRSPEVAFHAVSGTSGMDLIESLRNGEARK